MIGKSVIRNDAIAKVTGKALFYSDISLTGMLYMKVLRSPYPHAKILSIDTSEAEKVAGIRCVVTSKDSPAKLYSSAVIEDRTILARDIVRYVGEPIVAVAAESIEAADKALQMIKINFKELPYVIDPEEAMAENPNVVIHPNLKNYNGVNKALLEPDRPNVFSHVKIRKGNLENGFKEADIILENKFLLPPVQHCTLETHGVVISPDTDGGLTFWTGRQGIWSLKGRVADLFGIRASKIRVIQQYVGGAFGSKLTNMEIIAALVALKAKRPIKWVLSREEEFLDGGRREQMVVYIKDGVKKDGTLVAREIKAILNGGAYDNYISVVTKNSSYGAISTYRIPNFKWDSFGVYTNLQPACAFRGFGVTETVFAIESHMDMLAERLNITPVEIRKKNLLREGEPNALGELTHSIGVEECIDKISNYLNDSSKNDERFTDNEWKIGRGIAIGAKYSTGRAISLATIQITADETIVLYHSADEIGQGCNTVLAQMVAEEFGVLMDDVQVVFSDTARTPFFGEGTSSSRTTFQLGNAVREACQNAKEILIKKRQNYYRLIHNY